MSILRASIICACWCTLFASLAACQSTPRRGTSRPDAPRAASPVIGIVADADEESVTKTVKSLPSDSVGSAAVSVDAGAPAANSAGSSAAGPPEEIPSKTVLAEAVLEDFNPMVYVVPRSDVERPAPLIVVLHGNFDRPEWECETWRETGSKRGWLLCPRGYPRNDVDQALDRWTYHGRGKLAVEITRAVEKLRELHPEEVGVDGAVLIGLSLGANMSPRLAAMKILPFEAMVLVEGGYQVDDAVARRAVRQGIRKVVYVCGERTACPRRVTNLQRIWRRAGVSCLMLVMPGAGHEYGTDFDEIANQVFDFIGGDEG